MGERSDAQRWRETETAVIGLLAVSVPSFCGLVVTLHPESQLLGVTLSRQTFSQGAETAPFCHCSDWDVITADYCSWPGILQLSLLVPLNLPSSVQFSCSVMSDSLWPHGLQHARPPCPSPALGVTHVHRVHDAIQPSWPLSSPSPPAFNLSQHQGLFKWVSSSHQVAKALEFQLRHQSFQWIFRTEFL